MLHRQFGNRPRKSGLAQEAQGDSGTEVVDPGSRWDRTFAQKSEGGPQNGERRHIETISSKDVIAYLEV